MSDLLPISTDQFSPEEFDSAFQELKYKAPGNDEIAAEFFKSGIASAQLLNIMNLVFETRTAPREWTKSVIIPIPKLGDLTDPANFRGISLQRHTTAFLSIASSPMLIHFLGKTRTAFDKDVANWNKYCVSVD